jgi:hypothetical protein
MWLAMNYRELGEQTIPWDQQVLNGLTSPGPYFVMAAFGCGIIYAAAKFIVRRTCVSLVDLILESLVVGTASTGLFLIIFIQSVHLITGRPPAVWGAFLGISVFYPFVGLSNILWFFAPWRFERFPVGKKIVAATMAIASLVVSCIWNPGNTS